MTMVLDYIQEGLPWKGLLLLQTKQQGAAAVLRSTSLQSTLQKRQLKGQDLPCRLSLTAAAHLRPGWQLTYTTPWEDCIF